MKTIQGDKNRLWIYFLLSESPRRGHDARASASPRGPYRGLLWSDWKLSRAREQ